MQSTFAFLVHPRADIRRDLAGWLPPLGMLPEPVCDWALQMLPLPPLAVGKVRLPDASKTAGWIMLVPYSARQMLTLSRAQVTRKISAAIDKAVRLGANVVGLGALTAPVTGGGQRLAQRRDVAITNGNAFTAAMTVMAIKQLLARSSQSEPTVALVGASGSVGTCVAHLLARQHVIDRLLCVARSAERLERLAASLRAQAPGMHVRTSYDMAAVRDADLVVVLTSSADCLVRSEHLKPGATVLDDTQPRNTDPALLHERPDVLVVDGGLVALNDVHIGVNIGLPPGCVYACLAETMLLALDGYDEHFSIGAPTVTQAEYIGQLAVKHRSYGFDLAPLHSFGRPIDEQHVTIASEPQFTQCRQQPSLILRDATHKS